MKKAVLFFGMTGFLSFTPAWQNTFQQLYTLTGTWVMQTKKGTLCEEWKKVNSNRLNNRSYKTEGRDTTWLEHVELIQKDNEINYVSTVDNQNGGKPVSFKLIEAKNNQFIFSNPEHDFPQRIVYQFISKDSLHAWIDGKYKGKEIKNDFFYKRISR